MCLAIPGKVVEVKGVKATVKYPEESREVINSGLPIKIGDYVLVQMGIIVKKISPKEAKRSLATWKKLS